jgi:hypothetical protein
MMPREDKIEAAARRVLKEIPTGKISVAARVALDDLRAALSSPPGLADVEEKAKEYGLACRRAGADAREGACRGAETSALETFDALLAAVRALATPKEQP